MRSNAKKSMQTIGLLESAGIKKVEQLFQAGAEGVILGCTEIALLVQQNDTQISLFDTPELHTKAAVERALQG